MAKKAAPVIEDDDDLEVEELEDETTPAKGKAAKAEDDVWGIRNGLIPLIKEKTGKEYSPRDVRILLRKMARDGSNRVEREIVAGNKSRYTWGGPTDPEVKQIIAAIKGGEIEAGKKAALDKLKADKAAKAAIETEAPVKGKTKTKKAAPPVDDDDDEVELDDDD